jgi:DNA-binding SARP family transcriptional activator
VLDATALALTDDETAALVGAALGRAASADEVARVGRTSAGWPAAAVLAATALGRGRAEGPAARPLDGLVEALVGSEALADAVALAALPLVDDVVAELELGPGRLDELVAAGLPLSPAGTGWQVLPDAVRDALRARGDGPLARATDVARYYADQGELRAAVAVLRAAGDEAALAALLGALPRRALAALDLAELRTALDLLPDAVLAAEPRALLEAVRIAGDQAAERQRAELLARLLGLMPVVADPALRRAAQAEQAMERARQGDDAAAEEVARAVLADAAADEVGTRGRALLALGNALAFRREPGSIAEAEARLREAAAALGAAGEDAWRAAALASLAYRVLFARGDLDRAADGLAAALATTPPGRERADVAGCLAEVLLHLGRLDDAEAAARESVALGRALGDRRLVAYGFWMLASAASLRGDRPATLEALRAVDANRGDWYDHPTGIEYLADAATMLARLGDPEAAELAARAAARAEAVGHPEIAWFALGSVEARSGDPALAEQHLVAYAASPQQPPRDAWRTLLVRAHAARRRGDPAAAELEARARAAVEALGQPDLAARLEPDLVRAPVEHAATLAVSVLGAFRVVADGREVAVPAGRPATLVKVCALAAGPVHAEAAIEALWPGSDTATGRGRLRNLLNRLRTACGPLIERDEETLRLARGVEVDAAAFERAAVEALAAAEAERGGLARTALSRYTGDLLPADRYAPWAAEPRERLRQRYLELLDTLAADARERGDLDEAVRLLERGIAAEPLDEARHLAAAELLLRQGRRGAAGVLVDRAAAVRDELGLVASPRLERLRAATGRTAVAG